MNTKQLKALKSLQNKLFEAVVFDTNPENWVGFGKTAAQLDKQEKDEASWCRRQASSSIMLWEKIDKLIAQHTQQKTTIYSNTMDIDIAQIEQEADQLLLSLYAKEDNVH